MIRIRHLYLSPGHNYFGHHGQAAGTHPMLEEAEVSCRAGRGLEGDRFLDYKANYKGQITFFAWEEYLRLCQLFGVDDKSPSVFRRNVVTEGTDLNALIGREFELQGVRFAGVAECTPCYWMDEAFPSRRGGSAERAGGIAR